MVEIEVNHWWDEAKRSNSFGASSGNRQKGKATSLPSSLGP